MLFFRRRKTTPYAARAADVYRFGPTCPDSLHDEVRRSDLGISRVARFGTTAESETPLFDQAIYATGTLPYTPVYEDPDAWFPELDLLALPIATGTLRGPSERAL